jgi:nitrogen fixation-related uncharacterized protein
LSTFELPLAVSEIEDEDDDGKELFHKDSSGKKKESNIFHNNCDNDSDDSSIPYPSDVTDDEKEGVHETSMFDKEETMKSSSENVAARKGDSLFSIETCFHNYDNDSSDVKENDDGTKRFRIMEELLALQNRSNSLSEAPDQKVIKTEKSKLNHELYDKIQSIFSYYNRKHHILHQQHLDIRVRNSVSNSSLSYQALIPTEEKVFMRKVFLNALDNTSWNDDGSCKEFNRNERKGENYQYRAAQIGYCLQYCILLFSNLPNGIHIGNFNITEENIILFQPQTYFLQNCLNPFIFFTLEDQETAILDYQQTHYVRRSTVLAYKKGLEILMVKIMLILFLWSGIRGHTPFILLVSARDLFRYCHCKVSETISSSVMKETSFNFVYELKKQFLSQDANKERKIHKDSEVPYGVLLENIRYLIDNLFLDTEVDSSDYGVHFKTYNIYK